MQCPYRPTGLDPWLRYKSDHHTSLFRGADDGKAETSAPTCNKKTSCDTARVPRMCVFSRATLSVAFLLSSTCSQLELTVSWKNARSVALIRRQPCSVAVAPKLSHLSHQCKPCSVAMWQAMLCLGSVAKGCCTVPVFWYYLSASAAIFL